MHVDHCVQLYTKGSLRFRDLTLEVIGSLSHEQRADVGLACEAGFEYAGDPRCWDGFDEINEEAKGLLSAYYDRWSAEHPLLLDTAGITLQ